MSKQVHIKETRYWSNHTHTELTIAEIVGMKEGVDYREEEYLREATILYWGTTVMQFYSPVFRENLPYQQTVVYCMDNKTGNILEIHPQQMQIITNNGE